MKHRASETLAPPWHSFHDHNEAITALLELLKRSIEMPHVLIALIEDEKIQCWANPACAETCSEAAPTPLPPLIERYCRRVISTGQALIVPDVPSNPPSEPPLGSGAIPVGDYIGWPLMHVTGIPFGVLCAFGPPSRQLDKSHIETLMLFGRLVAFQFEREEALLVERRLWQETNTRKSEIVSLVSHELRTPLTSIKGFVDLLFDGEVGVLNDDQHEFLNIVKNNVDRLVSMINDLLDVSRLESGKLDLNYAYTNIDQLLRAALLPLFPQMRSKSQTITLNISETLPQIWCDADRVIQILTNLLSNAHKYTPPHGTINIAAQLVGDWVQIEVSDTGIGLSPDEQDQLFTKFYRAKNEATERAGGTGLGLVITRSFVEMHGGKISVRTNHPQGSIFSFTLPVVKHPNGSGA